MAYEPPNPLYIYCPPPQIYFVDKDTGFPLAAGKVYFYEDVNRTVLKPIYQQVQLPDTSYTFVELNNPVILTSVGTFADDNGNDIDVYLWPYANSPSDPTQGDVELYYLEIYSSEDVLQFTREAWPPDVADSSSAVITFGPSRNQITNPQFVDVSYIPNPSTNIYTYNVGAGTTTLNIAPSWQLVVTAATSGTVTVQQVSITDKTLASHPPYALQIGSTGLSQITLTQTLEASPLLLYGSFLAGYLLARTVAPSGTTTVRMIYKPDTGTDVLVLEKVVGNTFEVLQDSVANSGTANTTPAPDGYIDIDITWDANVTVQVTSAQILGVQNDGSIINFLQESTAIQESNLSYYYQPQLEYKPIANYAVGWDFAFNPCQQLGTSVAVSGLGNNLSRYIADQTIAFEAVGNSASYNFGNGGVSISLASASQIALIQYLPAKQAYQLIHSPNLSVMIQGGFGATGYVSMYWTTGSASGLTTTFNANGTNYTSGNSLVTALTNGIPTVAAGWNILENPSASNVSGQANFAAFNGNSFGPHPLTGWVAPAASADVENVTYFAIVVSFDSIPTSGTDINYINYITLNAGNIPTPPAPMNSAQTLQALQYYYQKSFKPGLAPAYNVGIPNGEETFIQSGTIGLDSIMPINFYTPMVNTPSVAFYNPAANNGSAYNQSTSTSFGLTQTAFLDTRKVVCTALTSSGNSGNVMMVNWTADSRPGTY